MASFCSKCTRWQNMLSGQNTAFDFNLRSTVITYKYRLLKSSFSVYLFFISQLGWVDNRLCFQMFGMVVTYVALLIQFRPPGTDMGVWNATLNMQISQVWENKDCVSGKTFPISYRNIRYRLFDSPIRPGENRQNSPKPKGVCTSWVHAISHWWS